MRLAPAMMLVLAGCSTRYTNMHAEGSQGTAPYADLNCFEQGNDEGFSFKVPGCSCKPVLKYLVTNTSDGKVIRFEYESKAMLLSSGSRDTIDEMCTNGICLPSFGQSDAGQREEWIRGRNMFVHAWRAYGPVINDMMRICAEDRFEKDYLQK